MASSTCKALVTRVDGDKSTTVLKDIAIPKVEPHQALVRVSIVAQNPTDSTKPISSISSNKSNTTQYKA